jgi:hypothetical protein
MMKAACQCAAPSGRVCGGAWSTSIKHNNNNNNNDNEKEDKQEQPPRLLSHFITHLLHSLSLSLTHGTTEAWAAPTRAMALAQRIGIITGGGSGLGLAVGRRLAAAGARVFLVDANAAAPPDLPASSRFVHADVTSEPDVRGCCCSAVLWLRAVLTCSLRCRSCASWTRCAPNAAPRSTWWSTVPGSRRR